MKFKLDCSELPYDVLIALPGFQDDHFKIIEQAFPVRIKMHSSEITLESSQEIVFHQIESVLDAMVQKIAKDGAIENDEIERLCYLASRGHDLTDEFSNEKPVVKTKSGKVIFAKTSNQKRLVHAFRNEKIIFASGVAGTGKTYLAVAYAVDQLKRGKIEKIILTRPAVEAGESLGFLPGDMKEKVDPYLRPLYDALNEMLGAETVERYQEKEIIEIAPLAFMRGRTLNDAIVILDEAQNTTKAQMKMFLTRMGRNCRMIINGDISQIDLIRKADSGLIQACHILKGIDGIAIQYLDQSDVVRNPLVQKIIERYETVEQ
ncbi:PhoH family protein [Allobaculum stercoricanis]|uniref:PhoH family protein n=1 Tax=Allobaculum stercoricanis TaxID=174709 RepID=UPI00037472F4|nr:PhoH family protein [Allobaculum stercoricanis]